MVRHSSDSKSSRAIEELTMVKVAAHEVGVGTRAAARAQTLATTLRSATTTKKRSRHIKISIKLRSNVTNSSTTRQQRRLVIDSENSDSYPLDVNSGHRTVTEERCSSPSLDDADDDHDVSTSASCCSSNGSCDERIKFTDLEQGRVEVETSMYLSSSRQRERTVPTSSALGEESTSENMDSTANPVPSKNSNSRQIRSAAAALIRIPDEEIEKFFGEIGSKVPQRFKDKYNFDFDMDEPLEGRYEWVRLNP